MEKEDVVYTKMCEDSGLVDVNHKQEEAIIKIRESILDLMQDYARSGFPIDFILIVSGDSKNHPTLKYRKHISPVWKDKFDGVMRGEID